MSTVLRAQLHHYTGAILYASAMVVYLPFPFSIPRHRCYFGFVTPTLWLMGRCTEHLDEPIKVTAPGA
jgi:hypothetical protein